MQHIFTEMGKEDGKGGQTLGGGADDTERRGRNRGRAKKLLHILHFELAYPIVVDRFASVFGLNSICILSSTAGDHSNRVTRGNNLHFTTRPFSQLLTILPLSVFTQSNRNRREFLSTPRVLFKGKTVGDSWHPVEALVIKKCQLV